MGKGKGCVMAVGGWMPLITITGTSNLLLGQLQLPLENN